MKSEPLWALAAGCVPDADPWDIPRIAADAGFTSSGMWVDPSNSWDAEALRRAKVAVDETGIQLIDVEPAWLRPGDKTAAHHAVIVDAALELGARNLLVVSRHPDESAALDQFNALCQRAGSELRVCLEFGVFTTIPTLEAAIAFTQSADHPSAGVLIDLMHLNRSGEQLPPLDDERFPYVQACDFWQASADLDGADYIEAAVDLRCPLGEGEARSADVAAMCTSDRDISLEIRSKALRDEFADPTERARQIFERCQRTPVG